MYYLAYCADPGDADVVLPVVSLLLKNGKKVVLIAKNVAAQRAEERKIDFEVHCEARTVIEKHGLPKLFLTGMCSQDKVARDLIVNLNRAGITSVALQDFWGSRLTEKWKPSQYHPTYICVNDEVGKEIVKKAWPDFDEEKVKIFSYPSLDKFKNFQVDNESIRKKLGLMNDWPIVLFAGQIVETGKVFFELISALNEIGRPVYLLPRQHPRWDNDAPLDDKKYWDKAISIFQSGEIVDSSGFKEIDSLVVVSTVTISMFSTVLVNASVLRKQNISLLYPDSGMKKFLAGRSECMNEFPLVDLGCTKKATSREELIRCLLLSFDGKLGLEENQEKTFKIDGKNTERLSNWLLSL
jgi:hypothetical protein